MYDVNNQLRTDSINLFLKIVADFKQIIGTSFPIEYMESMNTLKDNVLIIAAENETNSIIESILEMHRWLKTWVPPTLAVFKMNFAVLTSHQNVLWIWILLQIVSQYLFYITVHSKNFNIKKTNIQNEKEGRHLQIKQKVWIWWLQLWDLNDPRYII